MKPLFIATALLAVLYFAFWQPIDHPMLESTLHKIENASATDWLFWAVVLVIIALGLATRFNEKEWVEVMSDESLQKYAKWDATGLPANAYARELVRRQNDKTGGEE